jgi:hypothetical protein
MVTAQVDPPEAAASAGAQITGAVTGEHGTIPTGSVRIESGGKALGAAELDAAGAYVFTLAAGPEPAKTEVHVSYPGDANHLPSKGSVTLDLEPGGKTPPSEGPCDGGKPGCDDKSGCDNRPGCGGNPGGDGSGSDGSGASDGGYKTLPFTGASSLWIAVAAGLLGGTGLALRRRRLA